MPLFITYASYSHSGVKGLVDKPSDRSEVIKVLIEKSGGKLVALYNTTGSNDVVLVSELPDGSDAVALGMAVAASGALPKLETVRAWTSSEFKGIAEKVSKYGRVLHSTRKIVILPWTVSERAVHGINVLTPRGLGRRGGQSGFARWVHRDFAEVRASTDLARPGFHLRQLHVHSHVVLCVCDPFIVACRTQKQQ